MKIIKLSKEYEKIWDIYLNNNKNSTVFHTLTWKEIVTKVYRFKPIYLIALKDNKVIGLLCSFVIESIIFGRKIVSTPFNFYNQPIADNREIIKKLITELIEIGKKENAKYIEIKAIDNLENSIVEHVNLKKREHYLISNLKLFNTPEKTVKQYSKGLTKNLRTLKRNAEKNKIEISWTDSTKDLQEFYNILIKIYRDKHAMIPQPFKLFFLMYNYFNKNFKLLVAKKENKVIAGLILLLFKDKVTYVYGASDEAYKNLSPSTLLVDYAIRWASSENYSEMDFGVTSPYQQGLLNFKMNFGTTTKKMPFYYYLIDGKKVPELDYYTSYSTVRKLFRYVPLKIIKIISPIITKHIG